MKFVKGLTPISPVFGTLYVFENAKTGPIHVCRPRPTST